MAIREGFELVKAIEKLLRFTQKTPVVVAAALILGAPVIFWNVFHYSVPMGYAGMFSLMAEQIADSNFNLPMEVPYYGPGGIPFAYPPLGLYLLAVLIKITGRTFIFLRFVPPLLSLLALIPIFFLSLEFSRSKATAFIALLLASVSVELYIPNAMAAGIVRAPGLGFSLLSLLFFQRAVKENAQRDIIFAGAAFGLAVLTHLSYAFFAFIWIALWAFTHPRPKIWTTTLQVGVIGLAITLPWIGLMVYRYSPEVFLSAFVSHGNSKIITSFENFNGITSALEMGLQTILKNKSFAILAGLGSIASVFKRQFWLTGFLLATFFLQSESDRFIVIVGCLLAGIGAVALIDVSRRWQHQWGGKLTTGMVAIVLCVLLVSAWSHELNQVRKIVPRFNLEMVEAGQFFQRSTDSNTIFLALVPQDEAEWLPYIFRREPLVAQWGSEWLGTYNEQTVRMLKVRTCTDEQDFECLQAFFLETGLVPDYLVALRRHRRLNEKLAENGWESAYQNSRYIIWRNPTW